MRKKRESRVVPMPGSVSMMTFSINPPLVLPILLSPLSRSNSNQVQVYEREDRRDFLFIFFDGSSRQRRNEISLSSPECLSRPLIYREDVSHVSAGKWSLAGRHIYKAGIFRCVPCFYSVNLNFFSGVIIYPLNFRAYDKNHGAHHLWRPGSVISRFCWGNG